MREGGNTVDAGKSSSSTKRQKRSDGVVAGVSSGNGGSAVDGGGNEVTLLERFVELPPTIVAHARRQPALLDNLAVACTTCGRWVPVEAVPSPDVEPRIPATRVFLQDAVSAKHLPGTILRRSQRLAARAAARAAAASATAASTCVASAAAAPATDAPPGSTSPGGGPLYIPNPQCFQCHWNFCRERDADFVDYVRVFKSDKSASNDGQGAKLPAASVVAVHRKRETDSGVATVAASPTTSTVASSLSTSDGAIGLGTADAPVMAQCCICHKWRRVRRPHPCGAWFCCALSPYAESRCCGALENIEWLSDVLLAADKLKALLRRGRKGARYMDPRCIRDSRQLLHHQRVQAAPGLFRSAGRQKDDAIDVDAMPPACISVAAPPLLDGLTTTSTSSAAAGVGSTGPRKRSSAAAEIRTPSTLAPRHPAKVYVKDEAVPDMDDGDRASSTVPAATANAFRSARLAARLEATTTMMASSSSSSSINKRTRSGQPTNNDHDTEERALQRRHRQRRREGDSPKGLVVIKTEPESERDDDGDNDDATRKSHGSTQRNSSRRQGRQSAATTSELTQWVQCGKCEKWRVVSKRPSEKALRSWECAHRTDIPTSCADPDEAAMETKMLRRLGLI